MRLCMIQTTQFNWEISKYEENIGRIFDYKMERFCAKTMKHVNFWNLKDMTFYPSLCNVTCHWLLLQNNNEIGNISVIMITRYVDVPTDDGQSPSSYIGNHLSTVATSFVSNPHHNHHHHLYPCVPIQVVVSSISIKIPKIIPLFVLTKAAAPTFYKETVLSLQFHIDYYYLSCLHHRQYLHNNHHHHLRHKSMTSIGSTHATSLVCVFIIIINITFIASSGFRQPSHYYG